MSTVSTPGVMVNRVIATKYVKNSRSIFFLMLHRVGLIFFCVWRGAHIPNIQSIKQNYFKWEDSNKQVLGWAAQAVNT